MLRKFEVINNFHLMKKDKNIDKLLKIISKYKDIEKVILFGSRARGDNNERADIDIAIDCPKMDTATFCKMIEEMGIPSD